MRLQWGRLEMMGDGGRVWRMEKEENDREGRVARSPNADADIHRGALDEAKLCAARFPAAITNFELCRAVSCPLIEVRGMYVLYCICLLLMDVQKKKIRALKNRRDPIEPTVHCTVPREQNREHLENRTTTTTRT